MDRLIYIAMTGAQQLLHQQAQSAHNLANASTTGFKADTGGISLGAGGRTGARDARVRRRIDDGRRSRAGRDSVDRPRARRGDRRRRFSDRAGAGRHRGVHAQRRFQVSPDGELQTRNGLTVLGDGGPITIPQDSKVSIGRDGTVSIVTYGQTTANVTAVGQLKLVKPAANEAHEGRRRPFPHEERPARRCRPNRVGGGRYARSRATSIPSRRWST